MKLHRPVLALIAGLCGCSSSDTTGSDPSGDNLSGAEGVTVTQVAIYQGPKRVLMDNGAAQTSTVPLIAGRDALVRVFYTAEPDQVGQAVTGRLKIDGMADLDVESTLVAQSSDADMDSTINIAVDGASIPEGSMAYGVELLQVSGGGNSDARYPQEDLEVLSVDGPRNTLRIILAPFAYNADGSGRVPDLSAERVELFRQKFLSLYPLSDVQITVREAQPWNQALEADGTGWQELGFELYSYRATDGAPDDVYYYGIFNPADTFNQYCGSGCLLGVTLLNSDPPETGSVALRLALGVGFEEYAVETSVHEIGHAHGRMHAPCGLGLDPSSIDPSYPYDGGLIGVWSWDVVGQELKAPDAFTDIMGYCDNTWISDYNYRGLFDRGKNVNLPKVYGDPEQHYEIIGISSGEVAWRSTTTRGLPVSGRATTVVLSSPERTATVTGQFFNYSHLDGGWLFIPEQDFVARQAQFAIGGISHTVSR